MEESVASVGTDGESLGVVLEGVGWGLGALIGDAESLALFEEREGGVGADVGDASGLDVAGDAEMASVGLGAHLLELGDGDVVALVVSGGRDGEPADSTEDENGGDDKLCGLGVLHTFSLSAQAGGWFWVCGRVCVGSTPILRGKTPSGSSRPVREMCFVAGMGGKLRRVGFGRLFGSADDRADVSGGAEVCNS